MFYSFVLTCHAFVILMLKAQHLCHIPCVFDFNQVIGSRVSNTYPAQFWLDRPGQARDLSVPQLNITVQLSLSFSTGYIHSFTLFTSK